MPQPPELPRGGRRLFPDFRVVAFYGAPQSDELGALGIGSPTPAGAPAAPPGAPVRKKTRPVLPAFELIATVANAHPGEDGTYRTRQTDTVDRAATCAPRAGPRRCSLLDIQPGHADFLDEVRHLDRWLREPDVGHRARPRVAHARRPARDGDRLGHGDEGQPGLAPRGGDRARADNLPEKLFVVHQFTADMIRDKARVMRAPGLAMTMNVDGFGDRAEQGLQVPRVHRATAPTSTTATSSSTRRTRTSCRPRSVLALQPPPDLVVYE